MEEEAEKLKQLQSEVDKQMMGSSIPTPAGGAAPPFQTLEQKVEADARSVYVGNVDYGATAEELEQHFHGCGSGVVRVTILCDKFTGHPKGFAYVEFADKEAVQAAMSLDESLFRGRQIKARREIMWRRLSPCPLKELACPSLCYSPTAHNQLPIHFEVWKKNETIFMALPLRTLKNDVLKNATLISVHF
jgi:RNA recognition motif-containing protein